MRRVLVMVAVLLLFGAWRAQAQGPPTGLMWGYTAESETIAGLRTLVYRSGRIACEMARGRDMKDPSAAWAGLRIPATCQRMVVSIGTDAEADFWSSLVENEQLGLLGAQGFNDREWCLNFRERATRVPSHGFWLSECMPVKARPPAQ